MIYIALPAYNEAENVETLLSDIGATMQELMPVSDFHVVVVNDGSSDNTREAAEAARESLTSAYPRLQIDVVNHPQNRGLAEAFKTGLKYCADKAGPRDIILTMDCDNSHTAGLIPRLARRIREGYDVVIASRYVPGAQVYGLAGHRLFLSYAASLIMRLFFPIRGVRDYTCGFRAYRAEVIKDLFARNPGIISERGFTVMLDVLIKLHRFSPGLTFGEVPLLLRYDLKKGASKMNVQRTTLRTLKLIARRRLGFWDMDEQSQGES